jgi:VIT1/CCC1 family predicted Fe2+/Mn2+ transporter
MIIEKSPEFMMDKIKQKMAMDSLDDELNGAYLYDALAQTEKDDRLAEVYKRMSNVERKHADKWISRLEEAGVSTPKFSPNWRTRTLAWAARRFGVNAVLPTITSMEQKDSRKYAHMSDAADMSADELSHSRLLTQVTKSMPGGMEGGLLARLEGRHRASGGNALRAAVLGANDGLVSNLSLVMGVAGAEFQNSPILITGLAGLLAGAFSMALGEWLSVQSSRELYQHQIAIEEAEIASAPEEEAQKLAKKIFEDPSLALETLAREELNIDPAELGGSAWEAAITSFILFAIGAIIPVISFTFLSGMAAVIGSLLISAVGLFIIGAGITLFTGRNLLVSGSRQVLFGLLAAVITFSIGRLIGVNIGG